MLATDKKIFLFIILLFISVYFATASSPYPANENPYNFDYVMHMNNNCNEEINNYNCNDANSEYKTDTPFVSGYSAYTNGTTDYLILDWPKSNVNASMLNKFVLSYWIKFPASVPATSNDGYVHIGSPYEYFYLNYNSSGELRFDLFTHGDPDAAIRINTNDNATRDLVNGWHHIIITKELSNSSNSLEIYIDGVKRSHNDMNEGTINDIPHYTDYYLGAYYRSDTGISGKHEVYLDDILICSNCSITASDVYTIYAGNYTPVDTTPPTISAFTSNATTTPPKYNEMYNVSFACSDDNAVSCSWYQTRNSSGSVNSTPDCSSPESFYAQALNLQASGEIVYLKPYCNDTSNNINTTVNEINFTVASSLAYNSYNYVTNPLNATNCWYLNNSGTDMCGSFNGTVMGNYDNHTPINDGGTSLYCDGTTSDYMDLADSYSWAMNDTWSIGFWLNSIETGNSKYFFGSMNSQGSNSKGVYFGYFNSTRVYIRIGGSTTASIIVYFNLNNGEKMNDGQWHHYSLIHRAGISAKDLDLFFDGNNVTSRNIIQDNAVNYDASGYPWRWMGHHAENGYVYAGLQGQMDEIIVSRGSAWTSQQINTTFFGTGGGDTTPPSISAFASNATTTPPAYNEWYNVSFTCSDDNAVSCSWYQTRNSSGSINSTPDCSSPGNFYAQVLNLQVSGETAYLKPYCNDTSNNVNTTVNEINFTVANTAPVVNSISATSPQGFGENVVITANVTDPDGQQYLSSVKVGITPPGGAEVNYSMWNTSSEIWTLNNFTDYHNGTYSYTVYAIDSGELMDSASGTFEMYDNLTISIFPLEMSYSGNEWVAITDPPGEWLTSGTGFNDGTYSQTNYNSTVNAVVLSAGQSSGAYTSKVYDAGSTAGWDSIEWSKGLPYGEELSAGEGKALLLHLNEASGAIGDASGKGNNGTTYGGITYGVNGKFNTALGFNGNSGVSINDSDSLSFGDGTNDYPFTISAWIYLLNTTGIKSILLKDGNAGYKEYEFYVSDGHLTAYLFNLGGTSYIGKYSTAILNPNQWLHVAMTYNGNKSSSGISLYVEGQKVNDGVSQSGPTIVAMSNTPSNVTVGMRSGLSWYFNGTIDEVTIYNRTLSSAEILEHYKRGALKLNLSVRSCDDSACSGESFVDVTDISPQALSVDNNTYFQYNFAFSSENASYSPELYNVTVDYTLGTAEENQSEQSNQSKLRNDAVTNTSIYLLMKVQYWNSSAWIDEAVRYFGSHEILPGEASQIKLDQYWQNWSTFDRIAYGVHRVYAAALDDENNTITNIDGSLVEAYHNFTVVNTAPSAPSLLFPINGDNFWVLPEFNWTESSDADNDPITYEIQIDNDSDFSSVTYSNSSMSVTWVYPTLPIRYTYFWHVRANDGYADSDWSSVNNFTYMIWNVTFNVTSGEPDEGALNNVNISCNYTGFNQGSDATNMYGPYEFPPGSWECTFGLDGYYNNTETFVIDNDRIINIEMSEIGSLTYQEHTWLEALYNCIILKDCDLYNLLLEINQTVGNTWQHVKPTDESVITSETAVSNTLNSTSNITYDYNVNIPIKAGYNLGAYLPVRIGFWFMDETNTTCYNQGTLPTGVTLIEPYCQPLMVETIGPMGGSVTFRVDLRPNLTAGTYNVKRIIEIDPLGDWIGYGQEIIETISVTEDVTGEGDVDLEKTGENMPSSGSSGSSSSSSSGGSGGGSSGGSKSITNIINIYNVTNVIKETVKEIFKEDTKAEEPAEMTGEQEEGTPEETKESSGLSKVTGAVISSLESNLSLVGILVAMCLVLTGFVGYFYAKSRRPK